MRLHDYWRSGASYRVRIALNLKGLAYAQVPHDLRRGEQRTQEYAAINPQQLIPAFELDHETVLTQSQAILEFLEEQYPAPSLLPNDPEARAIVRAMTAIIACDVHPLNNLRVLTALRSDFGASEEQVASWVVRWMEHGFSALEPMIAKYGGSFAFGDSLSFADCYLVPQLYSARRFGVPLDAYPRLVCAGSTASALPSVAAAHPDKQSDAA